MKDSHVIAFKEWSVVCAALADGRQSVILRKGGIHEGHAGFRVEHEEFWLFPTGYHQEPDDIVPEAWPLMDQGQRDRIQPSPTPEANSIGLYAIVSDVLFVEDLRTLANLQGHHIWSNKTVEQRFHYRSLGLFVLIVRAFRTESSMLVPVTPVMAGCKSWVELPGSLPTADLHPVITDEQFENVRRQILDALSTESCCSSESETTS